MWARPVGIPFLIDNTAYIYTDEKGELIELLNESDLALIGITGDLEYSETNYQALTNIQYDGSYVYFTYDSGVRDKTQEIGCRYGYAWEKLAVYRKSLSLFLSKTSARPVVICGQALILCFIFLMLQQ